MKLLSAFLLVFAAVGIPAASAIGQTALCKHGTCPVYGISPDAGAPSPSTVFDDLECETPYPASFLRVDMQASFPFSGTMIEIQTDAGALPGLGSGGLPGAPPGIPGNNQGGAASFSDTEMYFSNQAYTSAAAVRSNEPQTLCDKYNAEFWHQSDDSGCGGGVIQVYEKLWVMCDIPSSYRYMYVFPKASQGSQSFLSIREITID